MGMRCAPALFDFLLQFQLRRCYICTRRMLNGEPGNKGLRATYDHVTPRCTAKGVLGNKPLSCLSCNSTKSNRMPTACEKMYAAEAWRAYCGVAQ